MAKHISVRTRCTQVLKDLDRRTKAAMDRLVARKQQGDDADVELINETFGRLAESRHVLASARPLARAGKTGRR